MAQDGQVIVEEAPAEFASAVQRTCCVVYLAIANVVFFSALFFLLSVDSSAFARQPIVTVGMVQGNASARDSVIERRPVVQPSDTPVATPAQPVQDVDTSAATSTLEIADSARTAEASSRCIRFPLSTMCTTNPQWLFLLAANAGGLGALLRGVGSIVAYIGQRRLRSSWLTLYYLAPLRGAVLGVLFTSLLRGDVFSAPIAAAQNGVFYSLGIAMLVGLFEKEAFAKLRVVAAALFAGHGEYTDALRQPPAAAPPNSPMSSEGSTDSPRPPPSSETTVALKLPSDAASETVPAAT
jgi:hypothetical protein